MGIPDSDDHPDLIRKDFPPSDCQPRMRYVALCDVLGFSALVKSYDTQTLAKKYDDMLREAKASCLMIKTYPSPKPWVGKRYRAGSAVFSDTILLWSDTDGEARDDAGSFFSYVAGVFGISLKMGFALRVGIAYGECVINPEAGLFIGVPVVNAYQTEQAQDWVGVACHPTCFDSTESQNLCMSYLDGWQCGPLIEYEIPIKTKFREVVRAKHSIDWPFWGQTDWGGLSKLEEILRENVDRHTGTQYEARWRRALDYCQYRLSKWKDIERHFSGRPVHDVTEKTPNKANSADS